MQAAKEKPGCRCSGCCARRRFLNGRNSARGLMNCTLCRSLTANSPSAILSPTVREKVSPNQRVAPRNGSAWFFMALDKRLGFFFARGGAKVRRGKRLSCQVYERSYHKRLLTTR